MTKYHEMLRHIKRETNITVPGLTE